VEGTLLLPEKLSPIELELLCPNGAGWMSVMDWSLGDSWPGVWRLGLSGGDAEALFEDEYCEGAADMRRRKDALSYRCRPRRGQVDSTAVTALAVSASVRVGVGLSERCEGCCCEARVGGHLCEGYRCAGRSGNCGACERVETRQRGA
jgi:hypothetical protein